MESDALSVVFSLIAATIVDRGDPGKTNLCLVRAAVPAA
jgi:hypothetical protein